MTGTTELLQESGLVAVLAVLGLVLAVTVIRLAAVPLAALVLLLDGLAAAGVRVLARWAGAGAGGDVEVIR